MMWRRAHVAVGIAAVVGGLALAREREPARVRVEVTRVKAGTTGKPTQPAMSDATLDDLARQLVQLYDDNATVWRDQSLGQGERQKRSREIMQKVSALYRQIAQGGRTLSQSNVYRGWQGRQQASHRKRRLLQLRTQLKIEDDEEWQVLSARVDEVLRLRGDVVRLENGTRPWSPADKLNALRVEYARPKRDKARLKSLLAAIRTSRAAARANLAQRRADLDAAQEGLVALLTLEQEAVLVLHQVLD